MVNLINGHPVKQDEVLVRCPAPHIESGRAVVDCAYPRQQLQSSKNIDFADGRQGFELPGRQPDFAYFIRHLHGLQVLCGYRYALEQQSLRLHFHNNRFGVSNRLQGHNDLLVADIIYPKGTGANRYADENKIAVGIGRGAVICANQANVCIRQALAGIGVFNISGDVHFVLWIGPGKG